VPPKRNKERVVKSPWIARLKRIAEASNPVYSGPVLDLSSAPVNRALFHYPTWIIDKTAHSDNIKNGICPLTPMNSKNLIGIAIGAFIGALLALQFGMMWWAGIIVGACLGWLCGEPKELVAMVSKGWRHVQDIEPDPIVWNRIGLKWQYVSSVVLCTIALSWSYYIPLMVASWMWGWRPFLLRNQKSVVAHDTYVFVVALALISFILLATGMMSDLKVTKCKVECKRVELKKCFIDTNFFTIVFRILRWFFSSRSFRFAIAAFLFAHTGDRCARFVFAGIGGIVGWEYGNPLVGMIVALLLYPLSCKLAGAAKTRSLKTAL
jgi:hypothetical protein